jgi:hypothetical protein
VAERHVIRPPNPKPEYQMVLMNLLRSEVGCSIAAVERDPHSIYSERLLERHFALIDAMLALQYQACEGSPPKPKWLRDLMHKREVDKADKAR